MPVHTAKTERLREAAAPYKISRHEVSEEEFAALEARARERKLTLSEWVRTELLEPRSDGGAGTEVLLERFWPCGRS